MPLRSVPLLLTSAVLIGACAAPTTSRAPERPSVGFGQAISEADLAAWNIDIRTPESINRLLRIADDEQLAGNGRDVLPPSLVRIVSSEKKQQLGLQGIGVLELVDEDSAEATLEVRANFRVAFDQVARANQ